jgi:hypothetical protein
MPSPHESGYVPQAAPDTRQKTTGVNRGPAGNLVSGEPDARESAREDREQSGTAFKIIYMDGSWQILKFVKGYTIKDGWIEFRDAHGQLQSVRSDDVRRISRLSVEEPKSGTVPPKSENLGARPGSEAGGSGADSTEQVFSKTRDLWNSAPEE